MEQDGYLTTRAVLRGVHNLHLVSGEDILGKVTETYDPQTGIAAYEVTDPVIPNISMGQKPGGEPSFRVGLLPLRPYLGGTKLVSIPKAYVMFTIEVPEQMEKLYTSFTSDIVIAQPGDMPKVTL
jgi:hypothetical protein